MAVYTGTCGALSTLIGCDDNSAGSKHMPAITGTSGGRKQFIMFAYGQTLGATPYFQDFCNPGCTPANRSLQRRSSTDNGCKCYLPNKCMCIRNWCQRYWSPATRWDAGSLNTVWCIIIVTTGTTLKIRTRLRSLTDSQIFFVFPNLWFSCSGCLQ